MRKHKLVVEIEMEFDFASEGDPGYKPHWPKLEINQDFAGEIAAHWLSLQEGIRNSLFEPPEEFPSLMVDEPCRVTIRSDVGGSHTFAEGSLGRALVVAEEFAQDDRAA